MKFRDLPAAQIGRHGETVVAKILRELGAGVVPAFKFSGENDNEAPAIQFSDHRVTLPDLDVSDPRGVLPNPRMQRQRSDLEVKTYKEPQYNRSHRCLVHGVPQRLFDQYVANEREKMTATYLGVLEVDSGALLVSDKPLSELSPRYACQCGCENDAGRCEFRSKWGHDYPQWYFRRDSFTEWCRLDNATHERLKTAHAKVSHAIRRHGSGREQTRSAPLSATAIIGDSVPRCEKWEWTCLPCDSTWIGKPTDHTCRGRADWRRGFWLQKLRWALPAATAEERSALIDAPIARASMVLLFGGSAG